MGVPMISDYDAANSPVNQNVSLADESFSGSGGGGINLMGSELAWSRRQRYQMISRPSDPIIPSTQYTYCGGVVNTRQITKLRESRPQF